jgi:large subunit ribosomal protein L25
MSTQSAATVTAEPRSELGSRANKRLRDSGKLPGVIYGHKQAVVPITLPKKEVVRYLNHGAHLFAVTVGGAAENVLVKDVQYDHLGVEVLHIDFARVDLNERVEVTVPLELKGTPKGEADGGVLQQIVAELEIECIVTGIPDAIRHNVSDLGMDSILHLKDIKMPDGVKALQDPELIIASVKEITEELSTEAAEGETAEPEVIGKKKEDEVAAPAEKK